MGNTRVRAAATHVICATQLSSRADTLTATRHAALAQAAVFVCVSMTGRMMVPGTAGLHP